MLEAQPSPACAGERMLEGEWSCQGAGGVGDTGMCPWEDPELLVVLDAQGSDGLWFLGQNFGFYQIPAASPGPEVHRELGTGFW